MSISVELLQKMMKKMDKDGDQKCSKEEFKPVYIDYMKDDGKAVSDGEFEEMWTRIDTNGDNELQVEELASFFGYNLKGGELKLKDEDDDDAILAALRMASVVEVETPVVVPRAPEKIERCKAINMKNAADSLEKDLLDEAMMGDLSAVSKVLDDMEKEKVSVRVEDVENGQMAIHKLARVGDQPGGQNKPSGRDVIVRLLELGGQARKDLNYRDKNGKTPLHLAAEAAQPTIFQVMLNRGADPFVQTEQGWTALHWCAQTTNTACLKILLNSDKFSGAGSNPQAKKKELIEMKNDAGRTALMLASSRDTEAECVKLLLDHGADKAATDKAGNSASSLATKAGRRKSRELLDAM